MFWRFEVLMMPTCLNLVPRRKPCLVHQPRDVSSQSGADVHAKNAGFSDHVSTLVLECRAVYWWSHSWTSAGCVPSRLLQWSALATSSKYSYPLAVHFYTGIFTTHYYRCFNDPFSSRWNCSLAFGRDLTDIVSLKPHSISFPSYCPMTLVAHFHPVITCFSRFSSPSFSSDKLVVSRIALALNPMALDFLSIEVPSYLVLLILGGSQLVHPNDQLQQTPLTPHESTACGGFVTSCLCIF